MYRFSPVLLLLLAALLSGQGDRGVITGTISDPVGALVPNAEVSATNPANGVVFKGVTTDTGNFTIPYVPSGTYDIAVEVTGFRRYEQKGVRVQVAQTVRVDVVLQLGSTSESISVTADASLLKTESATQSTTVLREQLNNLPLNFGLGAGAVRNPLSFVQLAPGASISGWNSIRVNGAPAATFKIVFEGQDATSSLDSRVSDESQPSVEALEEFTLQTSNFAAEFGQVGGGLFNFTSRSGTNQFHGSAYDYMVNEAFNAGVPFTNDGRGRLIRPRVRRHDFGGSIGGPVWLPKIYNGRGKTFFFFNYEMFRDIQNQYYGLGTVPTSDYRGGNFSGALTGRVLGQDQLGRSLLENSIYDPNTARVVDGRTYRDVFPGNIIPTSRFDPVAAKIQSLIPTPLTGDRINNFERRAQYRKIQAIPSIKVDHNFSGSSKVSGYYSSQRTDKDNGQDGLPDPISARRDQLIRSNTVRINYDQSLSPVLLLHVGAGYVRYYNPDAAPESISSFDTAGQLGLKGGFAAGFPRMTGLNNAQGGMIDIGPTNRNLYVQDQLTGLANLTYVRGNHTYKAGGEWGNSNFTNRNTNNVAGTFGFGAAQTGLPALEGVALPGGNVGFPYASFLLGQVNNASVSNTQDPQYRKMSWAFFVQDTWKVTRKLTLDYGLRYDLQPAPRELWRRQSMWAPTIANPAAGGLPGATIYEGNGPGRCNCTFASAYPYAIGPRLGIAYQLNPKTVVRGGFAVSYGQTSQFRYIGGGNSLGMGFNTINFTTPAFGSPAVTLNNGLSYNVNDLLVASYDAGIRPSRGQLDSPPAIVDPNAGRPPRIMNWNLSVQREFFTDLVVEAAYVGNRGAWFMANGLVEYNALSEDRIRGAGLDLNRAEDRTLLTSRVDSPLAAQRGFNRLPYAGFPTSATVAQTLRPFPQFGGLGTLWAPLGNNWYDSLQIKATKRYSRGLTMTVAYTWSKTLTTVEDNTGAVVPINDVFNRRNQKTFSSSDQPHVFVTGINYQTPVIRRNKLTRWLLSDYVVGGIFRYSSGTPIRVPGAQNNLNALLFRGTFANRVPGEPLFLKDLNCHCIDPNAEFVLNPKAWADPGPGQWGFSAPYFDDYRFARRYDEQLNFGRNIAVREGMTLSIRAEFFNVFNRTYLNNPDFGNALATPVRNNAGVPISGFGRINAGSVFSPPRSGQIVARFQF
ncbi:MAG: TonB-dependent receptor [Bryobacterales bacterium]|nr:TonB-dependent receptor [Bryobacterales bacterium]